MWIIILQNTGAGMKGLFQTDWHHSAVKTHSNQADIQHEKNAEDGKAAHRWICRKIPLKNRKEKKNCLSGMFQMLCCIISKLQTRLTLLRGQTKKPQLSHLTWSADPWPNVKSIASNADGRPHRLVLPLLDLAQRCHIALILHFQFFNLSSPPAPAPCLYQCTQCEPESKVKELWCKISLHECSEFGQTTHGFICILFKHFFTLKQLRLGSKIFPASLFRSPLGSAPVVWVCFRTREFHFALFIYCAFGKSNFRPLLLSLRRSHPPLSTPSV